MSSVTRFLSSSISISLALFLVACGGGGGDGGGGGGGGAGKGISGVTLGGGAVKGIIKNGHVVADELDASGAVIRTVGSATTAADGSYKLTVDSSYTGGPIQLTITADASTEMKCDIPAGCGTREDGLPDSDSNIDFGEWYKPGSLTMKAMVATAVSGDSISVQITPYTDVATRRAKEAGSLTAAVVNQANSEVSNLLGGIDIMRTKPLDITDPTAVNDGGATEVAYAAMSAAIGALADTSSGHPDINAALTTLGSSFVGGTMTADDSGTDPSVISLKEIVTGARNTLGYIGRGDTSGAIDDMDSDVASAVGGVVDPKPSDTAGDTTLAKVKAFVTDVRTWGTVISTELDTKANAFSDQADLASTAANASGGLLTGKALNSSVQAIGGYFDGTYTGTDLSAAEYSALGFTSGTISKNSAGDVLTITDAVIDGFNVNMVGLIPVDDTTASSFTLGIQSATFRGDAADADINNGTYTISTTSSYTFNWAEINAGTIPDISGGSINIDLSLTQKQDEAGAPLAAVITFTGKLSAVLTSPAKDSTGAYVWITPKTLSLSGGVTSSAGHSLDFNLTANVTNADTFVPQGALDVGYVKTGIISWSYVGDTFTFTSPDMNVTVVWNPVTMSAEITQSYSDGYTYTYTTGGYSSLVDVVVSSSYMFDYYYYSSATFWVDGEGGYTVDFTTADISVDGSLDGVLVDPDYVIEGPGAGEWLDADVGLTFNLQLSELPKASVNISADRTDYQAGNASVTIAYGVRQIVVSADITDTTATGNWVITNQDGVVMHIDSVDFKAGTGTLTFEGTKYADMTTLSNGLIKIKYIDGTFETL